MNLSGVRFDEGSPFNTLILPDYDLGPGQRVIVTNDRSKFEAEYGNGPTVIAEWAGGSLSNGGEEIVLRDPDGNIVLRFEYDNAGGWPGRSDGGGSSLIVIDTEGDYSDEDNWTASPEFGGSPGTSGSTSDYSVSITEVLSHTDLPSLDTIEIRNDSDQSVDISGWYLSDSDTNWKKYEIPADSVIPSQGYITFDESDFNPNGLWNPNAGEPADWEFAISSSGDQVYLIESENGKPLYFAAERDFGAARNGVSFGQYLNSEGKEYFTAQSAVTIGSENSAPLVGPLVITEIMYQTIQENIILT